MGKKTKAAPQPLSEAQLEIMHVVWDQKEATVAQVRERLRQRRPIARNTVQTMMTRLEKRGWLRHRTAGNTFVYSAVTDRTTALRKMVSSLVDTAFKGSAENLVMALLDTRGVSQTEAERIRKMIDRTKGDPS